MRRDTVFYVAPRTAIPVGETLHLSTLCFAKDKKTVTFAVTVDPPPVIVASGCSNAANGQITVHFADATPNGVVNRSDIVPVVICGPASIAYAMQTYVQWVLAGPCPCNNGGVADNTPNPFDALVLSPADTSAMFWDNPDSVLTRPDSLHWALASNAKLRWKMLGGLIYSVMNQAQVSGLKDSTPVPVDYWWSYVPAQGGMLRTTLSVDSSIDTTAKKIDITLTRAASLAVAAQ
jgi:hypothetical protein